MAASAATKLSSAIVANHKRGRDERRQVYRRFQEAVVAYVMQIRDSRISPEAMGLQPSERKPYLDALVKATTELAQAMYEVRLVGNPGPVAAAEAVRQAINNSFDAAAARRENLTDEEAGLYAQAMQIFTEACQRDLWYRPPWWQVWRVSWWRARRGRARKEQAGKIGEAPDESTPPVQVPTKSDVAFGIGPNLSEPVFNVFDARIADTVIQAKFIHGGIFMHPPTNENPPKEREP